MRQELMDMDNNLIDSKEANVSLNQGDATDVIKIKSPLLVDSDNKYIKAKLYKDNEVISSYIYQHKLDKDFNCKTDKTDLYSYVRIEEINKLIDS